MSREGNQAESLLLVLGSAVMLEKTMDKVTAVFIITTSIIALLLKTKKPECTYTKRNG